MRCTCPEDWQGMDHTAGCKARTKFFETCTNPPDPSQELMNMMEKYGRFARDGYELK